MCLQELQKVLGFGDALEMLWRCFGDAFVCTDTATAVTEFPTDVDAEATNIATTATVSHYSDSRPNDSSTPSVPFNASTPSNRAAVYGCD